METQNNVVKIGLFGIGLDKYWPQFKGLKDRLEGYQAKIQARLAGENLEIINAGLVDNLEKSTAAGALFSHEAVDLVFLYISTYALSSTVLPVVQSVNAPVVVLNLQPTSRIDYHQFNQLPSREEMTGEWLANCQVCSTPEIASVFNRAGIDYHLITGTLHDPETWKEIEAWVQAARVAKVMRNTNIGLLGHYYGGMLDVYSDYTQLSSVFGNHFDLIEMDELGACHASVNEEEIQSMLDAFQTNFLVSPECPGPELRRAALTSAALHKLVEKHHLGALAYYYEGQPGSTHEDIVTSVIAGNTMLTANHVPVAGEYEVKNVLAMKIMDTFDCGGSFSEFYAIDFDDDIVILGHDGPGHTTIAEGRVSLVPLQVYHGKPGKGLSIQMSVKLGPVTLLSVCQDRQGRVKLLTAEGETRPGPVLNIGNTNSRYYFSIGAKAFVNAWVKAGPSHHCAIGVGHIAQKIELLGAILGIETTCVC
jgi:L-arabinose isomerase